MTQDSRRDYDSNFLMHPLFKAGLQLITPALIGVFGWLWTANQHYQQEKLDGYDTALAKIQTNLTTVVGDVLTIKTKQDAGRVEWNMREGRVIVAIDKLVTTLEAHTTAINALDIRVTSLERQMASNRKEWERRAAALKGELER